MRQQTEAELNAEFSVRIVKTSGNPAIEVRCKGDANHIACALVDVLGDITAGDSNPGKSTENVINAYRKAVSKYTEAPQ